MKLDESARYKLKYKGLSTDEAQYRNAKYGLNVLTPPVREPWWKLFLEKFDDPVIRILIIAAVIAIGVGIFDGSYEEGLGIILAVLLATTLAFINEYKANQEFDILNNVNDVVPVKVIRDEKFSTIARSLVTIGDYILIEMGEEIPADCKIVNAVSFQVDESKLTGESDPVYKSVSIEANTKEDKPSAYPVDSVYRGTMVVDGHALLEVVEIGDGTEIGKTARAASEGEKESTPLNSQLAQLSKIIGVFGTGIAALTFGTLVVRGVILNEIVLMPFQWWISFVMITGICIALIRVWLPIVYDGLELLLKSDATPPVWLEKEGLNEWLKALGFGSIFITLGLVSIWGAQGFESSFNPLIPKIVAEEFLKFFMIAVTIIVVAVPEGLAMSVTLSLAYSMRKMTASNNLVRQMHACETIGAATVICSDKTGTLTMNQMSVKNVKFPSIINGESLTTSGNFGPQLAIEGLSANSTAYLRSSGDQESGFIGNPTEGAVLFWLDEQGVDYLLHRESFQTERQWTFSTDKKFMATLGKSQLNKNRILHIKGAPEIVLDRCKMVHLPEMTANLDETRLTLDFDLKEAQKSGMRTLAVAYKEITDNESIGDIDVLAQDLTWLGFLSIADTIRVEVPGAIKACFNAGVEVKIVTGDNAETAQEVARSIGQWTDQDEERHHISGKEFAALNDVDATIKAIELKILSRARPMDKLRLVRLLKDSGHIVAVTGDGTNDAPALKNANVGLAMGKSGTAIAKEASHIILLDDSFQSIVNALMWGRSLYENIQRFIIFQLTINVAALGVAFLGPFIGVKIPFTVTQMLWINLIMDTFAALAFATEPPRESVLSRQPRKATDFIITTSMAKHIFITGGLFLLFLLGFIFYLQSDHVISDYELSVFFTVFVMLQFWNLFNVRSWGSNNSAMKGMFDNKGFVIIAIVILIGQIILINFGGHFFRVIPISFEHWLIIGASTSIVLWSGELLRYWERKLAIEG